MVRRCVIDTLAGGMSHAARQGMAHWGSQTQQLCLANTTHHRLAQRTFQRLALRSSSVHIFLQAGTIVVVHTFMCPCALAPAETLRVSTEGSLRAMVQMCCPCMVGVF